MIGKRPFDNYEDDQNYKLQKRQKTKFFNSDRTKPLENYLLFSEDLRASMWESHGFIVDKNLQRLGEMLIEKGVKCYVFQGNSDEICNLALEKELVLITSN